MNDVLTESLYYRVTLRES